MSRRTHGADAGTDSFLDVLANLVGILVILVVVTALRAAAPAPAPPEPPAVAEPEPVRRPLIAPKPNVVYEYGPPPPAPTDLVAATDAAHRRADDARARLAALAARSRELADDAKRTGATVASLRRELTAAEGRRASSEESVTAAAAKLAAVKKERERWALALAEAEHVPPPTEPLEHRLLPVGKVVTGRELHFRLVGGPGAATVRPVPIQELTDRLKADARAHRDRLLLRGRYSGTVGPVSGYEMRYEISAETDVLGRVSSAPGGGTRFALTRFTLHSTDDSPAEPVAAALAGGSDFRFALATAGADATATFWVAPEAFAAYRDLQAAARAAGLTVAARPLPADVPISGSPRGTRSVAQ